MNYKSNKTTKFIILVFFMAVLPLLSSCNSGKIEQSKDTIYYDGVAELNANDNTQFQYSDGYIYYWNINTLMRYNIRTGNLTSVCADPLCSHTSTDCPLYGVQDNFYVYDNKVYFLRFIFEKKQMDYACYDLETGSLSVIDEYPNTGSGYHIRGISLFVGQYRYYYKQILNESSGEWEQRLCRMDLSADDIHSSVIIAPFENTDISVCQLLFSIDGRIYLSDGRSLWSSEPDFTDKKVAFESNIGFIVKTDGKHVYYSEDIGVPNGYVGTETAYTIHRVNFDGTGDIDLGVTVYGNWVLTENMIYYRKYDEIVIGKSKLAGYAGEEVYLTASEIHGIDKETLEDKLLYTFCGAEEHTRLSAFSVADNCVYGNYFGINDDNGDGYITADENYSSSSTSKDQSGAGKGYSFMKIHLTTGEVEYISE